MSKKIIKVSITKLILNYLTKVNGLSLWEFCELPLDRQDALVYQAVDDIDGWYYGRHESEFCEKQAVEEAIQYGRSVVVLEKWTHTDSVYDFKQIVGGGFTR